ncbi:chain length determinant protein EpsF [Curvibacter sp. APW13]|uniref:chain length determinant protein EpsF n=1 Tax=Curvibacter sp. APW13 TaxID=3077236 RepID=UPI0028DFE738|nr:chain length determinant protein EpsF [Curvibacter sp. APW13]MDT8992588.1 chain length determinant protein EpsF [Curvibacter sp. APW13]
MSIYQFLLIMRARYRVALLLFVLTVSTVLGISIFMEKQYTASAALILEVKSPDPVSGIMLQGMMSPGYMATQIDVINSDRVAKAVVQQLRLDQGPTVRELWLADTNGKGQLDDWLANLLQQKLDVKPSRESNVINITYTSPDPDFAAAVANAFAKAYTDVNLDLRQAPARQYAAFFDAQTQAAREKIDSAQRALSEYQQENGITSSDERMDFETAKLSETSSQLTSVQGQTTESQSKRGSARTETLSDVMQNPVINGLKVDVARLESKLAENNVNLGRNHPQTLRAESELAALRVQIEAETRKVNSSIETSYAVSRAREGQLQGAISAQKARVLVLNKQRGELNVLRRDIESAQRSFEVLSGRAAQASIESQANQTNISVLNPAVAPIEPSKPRVLINTLISVFLGLLLGVSVALVLELTHSRIRSRQDIFGSLGLPLLGAVVSTSSRIGYSTNKGQR